MRILHTSDWHLGHTLHDLSREVEHRRFLAWLLEVLDEHRIDALLIAGDIFETANPSAVAQEIWYGFLADVRRRFPRLDIVVIGGNHDSSARLDAPRPILAAHDVFLVGGLPKKTDGSLDLDRLLAPLHDADGEVKAWVAVVPYLRIADLPRISDAEDPLIEGVRQVYAEVIAAARQRRGADQALIATGPWICCGCQSMTPCPWARFCRCSKRFRMPTTKCGKSGPSSKLMSAWRHRSRRCVPMSKRPWRAGGLGWCAYIPPPIPEQARLSEVTPSPNA